MTHYVTYTSSNSPIPYKVMNMRDVTKRRPRYHDKTAREVLVVRLLVVILAFHVHGCTCDLPPITCKTTAHVKLGDNQGARVTCLFHQNVRDSRTSFSLVHYPSSPDIPGTDAVVCIWVGAELPECAVREDYQMVYDISDTVSINILKVNDVTAGNYACHLVPLENRAVDMCHVQMTDPVAVTSDCGHTELIAVVCVLGGLLLLSITINAILCLRRKAQLNCLRRPKPHKKNSLNDPTEPGTKSLQFDIPELTPLSISVHRDPLTALKDRDACHSGTRETSVASSDFDRKLQGPLVQTASFTANRATPLTSVKPIRATTPQPSILMNPLHSSSHNTSDYIAAKLSHAPTTMLTGYAGPQDLHRQDRYSMLADRISNPRPPYLSTMGSRPSNYPLRSQSFRTPSQRY